MCPVLVVVMGTYISILRLLWSYEVQLVASLLDNHNWQSIYTKRNTSLAFRMRTPQVHLYISMGHSSFARPQDPLYKNYSRGQESSTGRLHIWPLTYDMPSRPRAGDDVKYNCWTKTESEPDARVAMPLPCVCHASCFMDCVRLSVRPGTIYTYNMRMNEQHEVLNIPSPCPCHCHDPRMHIQASE